MLRFDGRVAVITGAGNGLGKAYALELARRGCAVVVNDLGGSIKGEAAASNAPRVADLVVAEIEAAGGRAAANYDSVEHGDRIIDTAIKSFGRVDIVINNAGILRDRTFKRMEEKGVCMCARVRVRVRVRAQSVANVHVHVRGNGYGAAISACAGACVWLRCACVSINPPPPSRVLQLY